MIGVAIRNIDRGLPIVVRVPRVVGLLAGAERIRLWNGGGGEGTRDRQGSEQGAKQRMAETGRRGDGETGVSVVMAWWWRRRRRRWPWVCACVRVLTANDRGSGGAVSETPPITVGVRTLLWARRGEGGEGGERKRERGARLHVLRFFPPLITRLLEDLSREKKKR